MWNLLVLALFPTFDCTISYFWYSLKLSIHYIHTLPLGSPGSNPGRPRELVQNDVAMSRCTNWPPKLSTNMVIDHCTLKIQQCMIHFCVRSNTLIKMMYNTWLFVNCTMIYDHICTQFSKPILDAVLQSYQLRRSNCVILDITKSGIFEKHLN